MSNKKASLASQFDEARIASSDASVIYEQTIALQHRLDALRSAMPLDGDLYQQATNAYDTAIDAVNVAWKAQRAIAQLVTSLEKEQ